MIINVVRPVPFINKADFCIPLYITARMFPFNPTLPGDVASAPPPPPPPPTPKMFSFHIILKRFVEWDFQDFSRYSFNVHFAAAQCTLFPW